MAYTVTVTENPTTVTVSADTVVIPSTSNVDSSFAIVDNVDPTKKLMFSVGDQATASTLTITLPALAASRTLNLPLITGTDTLASLGLAQTWTATQAFAAITATNVTNSALTSGRVAIVGAGGLMADNAGLTFSTSNDNLVVGDGTTVGALIAVNGPVASNRNLTFRTAGGNRWVWNVTGIAESGADAGSNISLLAYDDSAVLIGTVLSVVRAASGAFTISRPTTISGSNGLSVGTLTATRVTYAGASGLLSDDSLFTRSALTFSVDPATDLTTAQFGYVKIGQPAGGSSLNLYIAQTSNYTTTSYALRQDSTGATLINGSTAGGVALRVNNVAKATQSSTAFTFVSGNPVTVSDTTASSTTAGALLIGTGTAATSVTFGGGSGNIGGSLTLGGVASIIKVGSDAATGAAITINGAATNNRLINFQTGSVARWQVLANSTAESGSDAGSNFSIAAYTDAGAFIDFPMAITRAAGSQVSFLRPLGVTTVSNAGAIALNANNVAGGPACFANGTATITGGVTDGYLGGLRSTPTYNAATALTVTRHNYLDLLTPTLGGVGPAALTDAAVFRFDAAPGTHKALAADGAVVTTFTGVGPTGAQTTIQGWMKINVAGTLRYIPFW